MAYVQLVPLDYNMVLQLRPSLKLGARVVQLTQWQRYGLEAQGTVVLFMARARDFPWYDFTSKVQGVF